MLKMVAFAFVHYEPKPSKISMQRCSSKPSKKSSIESSSVPVEALPALKGALGEDKCCQKAAGDCVATIQGTQTCTQDMVETQELIAERDTFENEIDHESTYLSQSLSSNYTLESAEELLPMEGIVGQGKYQTLDDSLFGSRGSRAGSTHGLKDEPFMIHRDVESQSQNDVDHDCSLSIVECEQMGYDTLDTVDMVHPPMHSIRATYEHGNDGISIDESMGHQGTKRERLNSLSSTSTSIGYITPLLPDNEDEKGSRELVGNASNSRADDICNKRRKVSTSRGRWKVFHNNPTHSSPPVTDDDEDSEGDDRTFSIALDARLTNSTKSNTASGVISPAELAVCPVITDVDPDWDVREIIGKEDIDGVAYYLVDWHPTLLSLPSLGHAKELVDEFEARIRAQRGLNNKPSELGSTINQKASVEAKSSRDQQGKKPRGRPRKQI